MSDAFLNWYRAKTEVMTPAVQKGYLDSFERLHPDLLDDVKSAIGAYNSIVDDSSCSPQLLVPLRAAALSKRRHLFDLAATLIGKLALRFDDACELILDLLNEKSWAPRFTALCCLKKETPRALKLKVIDGTI